MGGAAICGGPLHAQKPMLTAMELKLGLEPLQGRYDPVAFMLVADTPRSQDTRPFSPGYKAEPVLRQLLFMAQPPRLRTAPLPPDGLPWSSCNAYPLLLPPHAQAAFFQDILVLYCQTGSSIPPETCICLEPRSLPGNLSWPKGVLQELLLSIIYAESMRCNCNL